MEEMMLTTAYLLGLITPVCFLLAMRVVDALLFTAGLHLSILRSCGFEYGLIWSLPITMWDRAFGHYRTCSGVVLRTDDEWEPYFKFTKRAPPASQRKQKQAEAKAAKDENRLRGLHPKAAAVIKAVDVIAPYGLVAVVVLLLIFFLTTPARAGHCRVQVRAYQHHAYVQPVVQNIFYSVGENIRFEAAVQKAVREALSQWRSLETGKPVVPATEPEPATESALNAKCAKCHSGATPKGGLLLDGSAPLNCDQILEAMKRVEAGEMPPKTPLSPDDAGAVFSELLKLSPSKE